MNQKPNNKKKECDCHCHKPQSHMTKPDDITGVRECRCRDVLCPHCQPTEQATCATTGKPRDRIVHVTAREFDNVIMSCKPLTEKECNCHCHLGNGRQHCEYPERHITCPHCQPTGKGIIRDGQGNTMEVDTFTMPQQTSSKWYREAFFAKKKYKPVPILEPKQDSSWEKELKEIINNTQFFIVRDKVHIYNPNKAIDQITELVFKALSQQKARLRERILQERATHKDMYKNPKTREQRYRNQACQHYNQGIDKAISVLEELE